MTRGEVQNISPISCVQVKPSRMNNWKRYCKAAVTNKTRLSFRKKRIFPILGTGCSVTSHQEVNIRYATSSSSKVRYQGMQPADLLSYSANRMCLAACIRSALWISGKYQTAILLKQDVIIDILAFTDLPTRANHPRIEFPRGFPTPSSVHLAY